MIREDNRGAARHRHRRDARIRNRLAGLVGDHAPAERDRRGLPRQRAETHDRKDVLHTNSDANDTAAVCRSITQLPDYPIPSCVISLPQAQ
jgi:hypothetical protein